MYFKQLIKTKKTVFTIADFQQIWQIKNKNYLKTIINRLFVRREIFRIKKGVYVLNKEYNIFELSNKLKSPSYISLETVLQKEGVVFQDYSNSVYAISNNTKKFEINKKKFEYFKIKNDILLNPLGIKKQDNYNIASKERAVTDRIYLTSNYYFDNLKNIDIEKLDKISKIYNKRTEKEIKKLIKFIKEKYA